MKRILLASLLALSLPAVAQVTGLVGQTPGGAINAVTFAANTDSVGFNDTALTYGASAAGTTQATATVLLTRVTVITTCGTGAGVLLPAVQRYVPITVVNRSGAACLVYPTIGATVESAPGTVGAVNAGNSQASNTTVVYRPVTPTTWVQ